MHHQLLTAATLLAAVANSSKTFHIGPWIIVPTLILVAIIGAPIYIVETGASAAPSSEHGD
jgi:hypothetical protein